MVLETRGYSVPPAMSLMEGPSEVRHPNPGVCAEGRASWHPGLLLQLRQLLNIEEGVSSSGACFGENPSLTLATTDGFLREGVGSVCSPEATKQGDPHQPILPMSFEWEAPVPLGGS